MAVEWDHNASSGKRVRSIRLTDPTLEEEDDPKDSVDFVEQADGTTLEIKQKKVKLGDEVKNEDGGRVYRIVSGSQ